MRRTERIKRKNKPITPIKKSKQQQKAQPQVSIKKAKRGGIYDTQYKKLLLIPFAILLIAIISIGAKFATTGDFINRGVSLKGGLLITIPAEDIDTEALAQTLRAEYPNQDIETRSLEEAGNQVAVSVTTDITPELEEEINEFISATAEATGVSRNQFSIETIGSSLGASFFAQTSKALFIAFLFMGLVVFLYFGEEQKIKVIASIATAIAGIMMYNSASAMNIIAILIGIGIIGIYAKYSIPSVAVILAAFSDIVVTLAVVNIIGMKISTAGIAAFLMLIGYSVDTDILLSTRVLKRTGGTVYDRIISALKTGLTMNFTTMAAVIIALIVAESPVIKQIMTILFIGLIADMINTWLQNTGILRWYLEKKEKEAQR